MQYHGSLFIGTHVMASLYIYSTYATCCGRENVLTSVVSLICLWQWILL